MPDAADRQPSEPRVSVVVPTRNRLHYLREALASALAQTMADLEVIVVDDESSDGTAEWLANHADPRLSTVRLERRLERSAARNAGLARARGRFVLFLDDDDRLLPTSLAVLCDALESAPGAFVAGGRKVVFDDAGNRKPWPHPRRRWVGLPHSDVLLGWVLSPGECLWRTDALRDAGGWCEDLSHAEDQELWLRLGVDRPAVIVPDTVLEYRRHAAQVRIASAVETEQRVREEFVAAAPPELRASARRAVDARQLYLQGVLDREAGEARSALRLVTRAIRTVPRMLWSPLNGKSVRHTLLRTAVEAALGRRGRQALRDAAWAIRKRRGQAIEMQQWAEDDHPPPD